MKQKKILVPTTSADSWKSLLADPEKHWKTGYSAKSAAESWEKNGDIPQEILLALNKDSILKNSELLLAIPEFKVSLPGGTKPSQNDLLVVMSNNEGLSVITVEAKAKEDFGPLIGEWLKDSSEGKKERLNFIKKEIGIENENIQELRYQLFHRFASAIIMAKKFHANNGIMIIQSFVADDTENHFEDFEKFTKVYSIDAKKEIPLLVGQVDSIKLYTLWVYSGSK